VTGSEEMKAKSRFMENIVPGVVGLLILVYLLVAVIRPEKF
jgi:K+-transporting ATPase KdpF subunit